MKTKRSHLRILWRVFKVSMMLIGGLALLPIGCICAGIAFVFIHEQSEQPALVWEYDLCELVDRKDVEMLADERRYEGGVREYEAVFRIPSEEAHQAFLAQIAARNPDSKADEPSPMLLIFIEEHSGEAPITFDLFAACPYSNTSNPILLNPGRNNTYYIRHRECR